MLNQALVTTRDGITGYWDPNGVTAPQEPTAEGILYLRPPSRGFVLDHELQRHVQVEHTDSGAKVIFAGNTKSAMEILRPDLSVFAEQIPLLRDYADLREDRLAEIHMQISDILSFFGALAYLDDERSRIPLEILNATLRLAQHVEMTVKHFCRSPRPMAFAPEIQPMIQTPDHSSFPSGHACESFAVAAVLSRMQGGDDPIAVIKDAAKPSYLFRLAARIAENRTVAGVHFPIDNIAGAALGIALGELVWAAMGDGKFHIAKTIRFDDTDAQLDFTLADLPDQLAGFGLGEVTITPSGILKDFWSAQTLSPKACDCDHAAKPPA